MGLKKIKNGLDNGVHHIKCLTKGKKEKFISRSKIKKNKDKIDSYKVAIPRAYATGARRCTLPRHQIFIIKKGEISTETYNIIDTFKKRSDAEKLVKYLQSDFARYLLGLRKLTQDIPRDRWGWVPYIDLNTDLSEEAIYKMFKITKKEQAHISKKIKEWS